MDFTDVLEYVYINLSPTDNRPSRESIMQLANNALDMINTKESNWFNTGSLTSEISMNIPEDAVEITRVVYDSNELPYKTIFELDTEYPDWRNDTGTPTAYTLDETNIILNCQVSCSAGTLKVYGKGKLPHFSDTPGATNPLIYIPAQYHLAPAYFVLSNIFFDPNDRLQVARMQNFVSRWENALRDIAYAGKLRSTQPFSF